MQLTRRLSDALRSPRRLWSAGMRAMQLVVQGEVRSTWMRLHPRGPDAREYRAFLRQSTNSLPESAAADGPGQVIWGAGFAPSEGLRAHMRSPSAAAADKSSRPWTMMISEEIVPMPGMIPRFAATMAQFPAALAAYSDHDHLDAHGQRERPVLKSRWDPEQLAERNYCGPVVAIRREAWQRLAQASTDVALVMRALAASGEGLVVHIPEVLYHVRADPRTYRRLTDPGLQPALSPTERVFVIIPTRDRVALLMRCVESIPREVGGSGVDLVLVDNGTTEPGFRDFCSRLRSERTVTIVDRPESFNFSRLCNAGACSAGEGVLIFLNNDAYFADVQDFAEIVGLARRPHIGAVGPRLEYEDGRVQSAGVFVGVNRVVTSALAGFQPDDAVVRAWCSSRRRVSAVMGACLAIEHDKFRRVNGFDEAFAMALNEVDLCLRLEACGYANVFTPHSRVVHIEGATRGYELTRSERSQLAEEERRFRERWTCIVREVDPAHHPWLSRSGNPFAFAPVMPPTRPRIGWRG